MGNPSQSYGASLAIWDHTVVEGKCWSEDIEYLFVGVAHKGAAILNFRHFRYIEVLKIDVAHMDVAIFIRISK